MGEKNTATCVYYAIIPTTGVHCQLGKALYVSRRTFTSLT